MNLEQKTVAQMRLMVELALAEDVGSGDITSIGTIEDDSMGVGQFKAKEAGVIAGLDVVREVFAQVDPRIAFKSTIEDGSWVEEGTYFATAAGKSRSLLSAERVALNFLQRMSGIATLTHLFMQEIGNEKAVVLDTRKTVPGLRFLDKWAVRLGGGGNHRIGLYDMVLIKDNHITAAGSIRAAVERVRKIDQEKRPIEVEVKDLTELAEALELQPDRIMLDNMSLALMREAVGICNGRVPLEASGNVSLQTVGAIAATGVDFISSGMLTHSVPALDINMKIK